MNKIKLVNKIIDVDNSRIIYDKPIADDWQNDWQVMAGEWSVQDGCLIGVERGNKGGVLFFKQRFDGVNVMLTCKISTVLPATRDVNGIFCAEWDEKTVSKDTRRAWATFVECRRQVTSIKREKKSNLLSVQSTDIALCLWTANLLPSILTAYSDSTRDISVFRRTAQCSESATL